jgi:hypothetical protein
MLFDAHPTQVTGGGGPLVRNFSSPSQQTRRSSRRNSGVCRLATCTYDDRN